MEYYGFVPDPEHANKGNFIEWFCHGLVSSEIIANSVSHLPFSLSVDTARWGCEEGSELHDNSSKSCHDCCHRAAYLQAQHAF